MENEKKQDTKVTPREGAAKTLRDLFEDQLMDIFWAENELLKKLPAMLENASDPKLKTGLKGHMEETKQQIERLKEVFKSIGKEAKGKKCDAMEGLLKEGESVMEETKPGAVRDAGIIAAAQKVEHYEIATYGTLAAYAKLLDEKEALDLLLKTLGEEKKSDGHLSAIADTHLNSQAMAEEFQPKKSKAV